MLFSKGQKIDKYVVQFPIKKGVASESYRVADDEGSLCFLKLICYAKLHPQQLDGDGKIMEISLQKNLLNPHLCKLLDTGDLAANGRKYGFLVESYISSETVADHCKRSLFTVYEAKQTAISVLEALQYLHNSNDILLHNNVNASNVLLDLTGTMSDGKLIDFSLAHPLDGKIHMPDIEHENLFYLSPERLNGISCVQSDIYSVGVLIYQMLFGMLPWFVDLGQAHSSNDKVAMIVEARQKPLRIPALNIYDMDEQFVNTMLKALHPDVDLRFQSALEFIKALNGELYVERPEMSVIRGDSTISINPQSSVKESSSSIHVAKGNGFKDVAGMDYLKEQLQSDVIDLLKKKDIARSLGISIPNGILFYGPPGCGKTFFARKLAEEVGCNFMEVHCSDIASPYIHGGQTKIGELFKEARTNAPTILFLDEIDALIASRDLQNNVSESGEVNEFLVQLNNCGKNDVLVIGATNKPDKIDKAALRSGRLEFQYYITLPDKKTRREQFEIAFNKYHVDFGLDAEAFAKKTERFSSADIERCLQIAGRKALKSGGDYVITKQMLEDAIKMVTPISEDIVHQYDLINDRFKGASKERKRIGYV